MTLPKEEVEKEIIIANPLTPEQHMQIASAMNGNTVVEPEVVKH